MIKYDVAIIGAGLSGLAAGIRLARFGRKVAIFEKHNRVGGMNSWYSRGCHELNAGLHAMTNFSNRKVNSAPLNKLLRQLRIKYDALELTEQKYSLIQFPEAQLRFSNDFQELENEIADTFPDQINGFRRLVTEIRQFPGFDFNPPRLSARKTIAEKISDPILREMLLCPMMYYGNPRQDDMDFAHFCVIFQSVFFQGLARPRSGIRPLLEILVKQFQEADGELFLKSTVKLLNIENRKVVSAQTDTGETIKTDAVLSCAGYPETMELIHPDASENSTKKEPGAMSFAEGIYVFQKPAGNFAQDATIIFQSKTIPFHYRNPGKLIDNNSSVICLPDNFVSPDPAWRERNEIRVRITQIADCESWAGLTREEYQKNKKELINDHLQFIRRYFNNFKENLILSDLFTPLTIQRYTGRKEGAVYGITEKHREGQTPFENLFICGTDQGFLGIVGALLSGISMANYHFFNK